MAWSKEDRSFKILINRRVTSSGKAFYEEGGATTLELNIRDLRVQEPPLNPLVDDPQEKVVKKYTMFPLTLDATVENAQTWVAKDGSVGLLDWLDINNGAAYGVTLYDANNQVIGATDAAQYFFDYITGILTFSGNVVGFSKPFKISGYRYVGTKGRTGFVNINDAATNSTTETYSVNKIINSTNSKFLVINTNGQRAIYDTFNECFNATVAGDRVNINTDVTGTVLLKSNMVVNFNGFKSTTPLYFDGISDFGGFNGAPVTNATVLGNPVLNVTGNGTWGIGTYKASSLTYYGDINAPTSSAVTAWKGGSIRAFGNYTGGSPAVSNGVPVDGYGCINAYEPGSKALITGTVYGATVGARAKSGGFIDIKGDISAEFIGVLLEGTNFGTASSGRVQGIIDVRSSQQANADGIVMGSGSTLTLVNAVVLAKGTGKAIRGTGTVYIQGSFEKMGDIDSTITIVRQTANYDITPVDNLVYDYPTWLPNLSGTSKRTLALKFNELDSLLGLLAPARALVMGTLSSGNIVQYPARLSAGLGAAWYTGAITAGSTVSVSYKVGSTFPFTLSFAGFRAGSLNQPLSYGQLSSLLTDAAGTVTTTTHNLTVSPYAGTTGNVTASNVQGFANFWTKADGRISLTEPTEGYQRYELAHTEAGKSPSFINFYDNITVVPTFYQNPTYAAATPAYKYLSGITLYGFQSTFNVSYAVDNLFNKTYVPTGATQISLVGMNTVDVDFVGTPAFDARLSVTNRLMQLDQTNQFSDTPSFNVRLRKPYNGSVANQGIALDKGINTFGNVATTTVELFQDESQRRYYPSGAAFVSSTTLPDGEAVVYNGKLTCGSAYYAGRTTRQFYTRDFALSVSPSGAVVFEGIGYADISAYNTGSVNVLLYLPTQQLYYDLGKPVGIDNGDGSGATLGNSRGCMSTVSDKIYFSFGTNNTVNNQNIYRMIVLFRGDAGKTITKITTSKQ